MAELSQTCLEQVRLVKDSIAHPEDSYLARTRLRRAILSCSTLVARRTGIEEPAFPIKFTVPVKSAASLRAIADCCNRLIESAEIVCQPSEPLDERWRAGWKEIVADLDKLENLLSTIH